MGLDGGISAGMGFFRESSGWNSALAFYTNNQTSGTYGVDAIQERMRISSSGGVGIGVVPESWSNAAGGTLELGRTSLWSYDSADQPIHIIHNGIYNNGHKYRENGFASTYRMGDGTHKFQVAPSGSAGSAISYDTAMTIDNSGNVGVGVSSNMPSVNDLCLGVNNAFRWMHDTNGTQYGDIYTDTSSNMVFRNGSSSTERMRITSSGVVEFKNGITESQVTNSGSTYTIDLNAGTIFNLTNGTLCTVTMPTATAGKSFSVIAAVPSAWLGAIKWSGGTAPTGTGSCIYTFVSNGTNWYGMEAGSAFA
jgi:hypothetical protein